MPETVPFDLAAYCARIGYHGPREPTLTTLRALHALHPAAIPFENLDPLLGRPVALDLASLQAKLVSGRRGGYCFEQNTVFAAALRAFGFSLTTLGARVRWGATPERPEGARSHMLLAVQLGDATWFADVGFGGYLLAAPVCLAPGLVQATPADPVRVVEAVESAGYVLEVELASGWRSLYRFTLEPQLPQDYEVANWFTSTNPTSLFTENLFAERLTGGIRYDLFNTRLRERDPDGRMVERLIENARDLGATLENTFGITPPAPAAAIWARLPR